MTAAAAKKILLVDDDEALRLSLGEQLRLYEFITVETGTGVDALNLAKHEHFDAILLDVGLPDMNGCEVCWLMRESPSPCKSLRMPERLSRTPNSRPAKAPISATR